MTMIAFDLPEGAFAALRNDRREVEAELRMAAAAKWYELGLISQERGAEIAGLTRVEFMRALGRFGVSPFQEDLDADDLADEDSLVMGESVVTFDEEPRKKEEVTNDRPRRSQCLTDDCTAWNWAGGAAGEALRRGLHPAAVLAEIEAGRETDTNVERLSTLS